MYLLRFGTFVGIIESHFMDFADDALDGGMTARRTRNKFGILKSFAHADAAQRREPGGRQNPQRTQQLQVVCMCICVCALRFALNAVNVLLFLVGEPCANGAGTKTLRMSAENPSGHTFECMQIASKSNIVDTGTVYVFM